MLDLGFAEPVDSVERHRIGAFQKTKEIMALKSGLDLKFPCFVGEGLYKCATNAHKLLPPKVNVLIGIANSEALQKKSTLSNSVLRIDVQTNTRRFQSLFCYLLEHVALDQMRLIKIALQLQKLKIEPVLLHYLSQIKTLQGLELRMTTSTRLKACLYSFTSPGGPMYPTRAVRHAAWEALDSLFPSQAGRSLRGPKDPE
ncbi:hypothetical protein V2J09_000805 [Rumex salicifolius]